jgi:hypothetical protein
MLTPHRTFAGIISKSTSALGVLNSLWEVPTVPAKLKYVQCASKVNRSAVTRKSVDGVEHIIVSSFTLPDDVVMNGGLYPAEEIAKSFAGLERTLAPVEHPHINGQFIPATDPHAIHNFHAGAFNANVTRQNGRVHLEKHINVQEAMKTERGKRLLDRIAELETSPNPRPIHTSTGVFLEVELLGEAKTNAAGEEYDWIARNMSFDHDAILLDSVAAATPDKGVGMGVNFDGDQVDVEQFTLDVEESKDLPPVISVREIMDKLTASLATLTAAEWVYVVDLIGDQCIFETDVGYMMVPYQVQGQEVNPVGIPIRVTKTVRYLPKTNGQAGGTSTDIKKSLGDGRFLVYTPLNVNEKGDAMKELLLNALAAANIKTEGLDDAALLAEYNKLMATNSKSDNSGAANDIAAIVANAVKAAVAPVTTELDGLRSVIQANAEAEKQKHVDVIVNSGKYPAIDADTAKLLPVEKLKEMAANCGAGYGLPFTNNVGGKGETLSTQMPE